MQDQSLEELVLNDWQYCIYCRRVSRAVNWRANRGEECCPYEGCGSPYYGGSYPYRALRRCYPELPETPEPGNSVKVPGFPVPLEKPTRATAWMLGVTCVVSHWILS